MIRLVTLLCLLAAFAATAAAAPEPVRIAGTLEDLDPRDEWYGVYMQGKKVGHARMFLAHEGDGEEGRVVFAFEFRMKMTAMGRKTVMFMRQRALFKAKAPWRFSGGETLMMQDGQSKRVLTTREGDSLKAEVREGLNSRELTVEAPDYTIWDEMAAEMWIRRGPEAGESITYRSYDIEALDADLTTFTVTEVKEALVSGVKTRFYEGVMSSEDEGEVGVMRCDGRGRLLTMVLGGIFEIRVEPEEIAKQTEYSTDLFAMTTVRIDKPLGRPGSLTSLTIEVTGERADSLAGGPRQYVEHGDTTILVLGEGRAEPVRATPKEILEGLRATTRFPVKDPQVRRVAESAVGDAKTAAEKVAKLTTFVMDYIEDKYGADSLTVGRILEKKVGDCTEHALLFTCLARAAGIPTREVGGLAYMGDGLRAFGGHAWNEVVIDGVWVPVDPTFGEVPANPARIRFGADGKDSMAMLFSMGKLTFRLLEKNGEKR